VGDYRLASHGTAGIVTSPRVLIAVLRGLLILEAICSGLVLWVISVFLLFFAISLLSGIDVFPLALYVLAAWIALLIAVVAIAVGQHGIAKGDRRWWWVTLALQIVAMLIGAGFLIFSIFTPTNRTLAMVIPSLAVVIAVLLLLPSTQRHCRVSNTGTT